MNEAKKSLCTVAECDIKSYHGHYTIPGSPVPLARARYGNKRVWDSQKEIRILTGLLISNQHGKLPHFEGPLLMEIIFYFPIPHSYSPPKKLKTIGKPHCFKPDLSNLIKFVEDIATGILYHDDCLISSLIGKKRYGEPQTTIMIKEEK